MEGGHDEQYAVRAHGARFVDLVGVDHEVFAQHRQVACVSSGAQIVGAALEEILVSEH